MEPSTLALEQMALDRLRQTYEERGYAFLREPSSTFLPAFLRDLRYRPDAIAIKGDEGVVIEVKLKRPDVPSQRLADLADKIRAQKGWHFHLLFLSDDPEALPPPLPEMPVASIRDQAREAQQLWGAGHRRAALLLSWATLEAAIRTTIRSLDETVATKMLTGRPALGLAGTYGLIELDLERQLNEIMATRNAVAHGDFDRVVSEADFITLSAAIDQILTEIRPAKPH
jgi:hypothetical protein